MGSLIINIVVVFQAFLCLKLSPAKAQNWIKTGYWFPSTDFPVSAINSTLFTHLLCHCADIDSTSYQLSLSPSAEQLSSNFTDTVKQKNPFITTLLSIGRGTNYSTLSSMVGNSSYRKSFIDSTIATARLHGFHGLDFNSNLIFPWTGSDMINMGTLFQEWRAAAELEAKTSNLSQLILTAAVSYSPWKNSRPYPIDSIEQYLDWVHVLTSDYYTPQMTNLTHAHAALYDPSSIFNTDYGIKQWIDRGMSANKLVLCLPFYGYSWKLVNPNDNGVGAPAIGPDASATGLVTYQRIKYFIQRFGPNVDIIYNSTYVVNYCTIDRVTWIGYDDIEAVKTKISYAREKKLLGYFVWLVSYDDNWMLSQAAAEEDDKSISSAPAINNTISVSSKMGRSNSNLPLLISVPATAAALIILILGLSIWMRKLKVKGKDLAVAATTDLNNNAAAADLNNNDPILKEYAFEELEAATKSFSNENKLGEGGYGPVYRGVIGKQVIAIKKLSEGLRSPQKYEEFLTEVKLTATLQHVNLVRVLGYCIHEADRMLVYEYMPNKSLDHYLFEPGRQFLLNWSKRIDIIEGITQGLLYLQKYSRKIIIHRDLKASNVLLDDDMTAKISDFGMAKIFARPDLEGTTKRIVGTYGYMPPEYTSRGAYSTKLDVYSFGILLLEIISGKTVNKLYGVYENLTLAAYAYKMWKDGKGMEFMDRSLDDTQSSCKLLKCLQIALLCVQENSNDRPSMPEVSSMLKNETANIRTPKKPAFSLQSDQDDPNTSTMQQEIHSANYVTISDVVGR